MSETTRQFSDLLIDLHETLDLEIKGWLDLNAPEHQAKLAKAIIAMANHGGGYVVIGFDEQPGRPATPSAGRPALLEEYNRDRVNGITEKYLEPPVHCEVYHVQAPNGADYPLIVVPGGHRLPIMAKRNSPNGGGLRQFSIYVRRAGPKSEAPRTAQEFHDLFDRCFANRRDEVSDLIRSILAGSMPTVVPEFEIDPNPMKFDSWIGEGCNRHAALVEKLPPEDERRFPRGYFLFGYQLRGFLRPISAAELLEILRSKMPRHTARPPWWPPTRPEIEPYPYEGTVECWLGRDGASRDAAHSDFWRVSPDGLTFLMRGYQEDGPEVEKLGFTPGTVIDLTVPVWRVGEALLHAQALASIIGNDQTTVVFRANYTGLAGRSLASVSRERLLSGSYVSRQNSITLNSVIEAATIRDKLPEIIFPLFQPFYELLIFLSCQSGLFRRKHQK